MGTDETASSSDRSSSFFRKIKRTNSNSLKRGNGLSTSDHTTESQKSWFNSGNNSRSKEEIYNTALHRANERQALKHQGRGGNENIDSRPKRLNLSEQLSALPSAKDSDDEYEEEDDDAGTETKSIFSSIISKIEDIYDDCS